MIANVQPYTYMLPARINMFMYVHDLFFSYRSIFSGIDLGVKRYTVYLLIYLNVKYDYFC